MLATPWPLVNGGFDRLALNINIPTPIGSFFMPDYLWDLHHQGFLLVFELSHGIYT